MNEDSISDIAGVASPLLPHEIIEDSRGFLKINYKKYLPFLVLILLFFILTFSSMLFIFDYERIGFTSYLYGFSLALVLFLMFLYPSIYSLYKLIYIDSLIDAGYKDDKEYNQYKIYFSNFYSCYARIFRRTNKLLTLFIKTFLIYIILFSLIIIPSLYIKKDYDSTLMNELIIIKQMFEIRDYSQAIEHFLNLDSFLRIEYVFVNGLAFIFFLHTFLTNFFYITFANSKIYEVNPKKVNKNIFSTSIRKNLWAFSMYYFLSFKYLIFGAYGVYIILNIIFSSFITLSFSISIISFIVLGIFIIPFAPYFLKQLIEVNDSFDDIYFKMMIIDSKKRIEKLKQVFGNKVSIKTNIDVEKIKSNDNNTKNIIDPNVVNTFENNDEINNLFSTLTSFINETSFDRRKLYKEYKKARKQKE